MTSDRLSTLPIVWQGLVNVWECDQNGHMNTRFYVERLEEGMIAFAHMLGFGDDSPSALVTNFYNMRFFRECHAGSAIHLRIGVVDHAVEDGTLTLFAILQSYPDEEIHSAFLVSLRMRSDLAPPAGWDDVAKNLMFDVPDQLRPRSFTFEPLARPEWSDPARLGFNMVASGVILNGRGPLDGALQKEIRISEPPARLSDGMRRLMYHPRAIATRHADPKPARVGGAMLEGRVDFYDRAMIGDRFQLWGGVTAIASKAFTMQCLMINPDKKQLIARTRNVSVAFDLDLRKPIVVTDAAREELLALLVKGL